MFLGHYAAGFTAKKIDNKPSLGTMLMAAQFIDLLWPVFLLLGIEKVQIDPGNTAFTPLNFTHYPYSHSLIATICWAILFGIVYYIVFRNRKGAILLGLLVLSHWVLDFATHRPDLPISFSEQQKVGLGLWNYKMLTLIIESILFVIGLIIYASSTKPIAKKGIFLLWIFVILLSGIYIASVFGPAPTSVPAIMYAGLGQWLFIGFAYWVDKNRKSIKQTI